MDFEARWLLQQVLSTLILVKHRMWRCLWRSNRVFQVFIVCVRLRQLILAQLILWRFWVGLHQVMPVFMQELLLQRSPGLLLQPLHLHVLLLPLVQLSLPKLLLLLLQLWDEVGWPQHSHEIGEVCTAEQLQEQTSPHAKMELLLLFEQNPRGWTFIHNHILLPLLRLLDGTTWCLHTLLGRWKPSHWQRH